MSQPKSNETIAEAIIQNHMLPDVADSSCLYFEPDRDEIKQDILEALAQKDAEVAEAKEWVTTKELPLYETPVLCALQHWNTKRVIYSVLSVKDRDDACWFDGDGEIDEMNWEIIGWKYIDPITPKE